MFEFGCGTGRFAQRLLRELLPADSNYVGIDVSRTMVEIARQRLHEWKVRAEVRQSDGSARLKEADQSVDRFVSIYVFDLLSADMIGAVLAEARRVLAPDGLLCLVSLTYGRTLFARMLSQAWQAIHSLSPGLVGGCRPLDLTAFVGAHWRIRYLDSVTSFGLTSQVVIAHHLQPTDKPR